MTQKTRLSVVIEEDGRALDTFEMELTMEEYAAHFLDGIGEAVAATCAERARRSRPAGAKPCPSCLPTPGAINSVPGHIFVGWGRGWQVCVACNGSGRAK